MACRVHRHVQCSCCMTKCCSQCLCSSHIPAGMQVSHSFHTYSLSQQSTDCCNAPVSSCNARARPGSCNGCNGWGMLATSQPTCHVPSASAAGAEHKTAPRCRAFCLTWSASSSRARKYPQDFPCWRAIFSLAGPACWRQYEGRLPPSCSRQQSVSWSPCPHVSTVCTVLQLLAT